MRGRTEGQTATTGRRTRPGRPPRGTALRTLVGAAALVTALPAALIAAAAPGAAAAGSRAATSPVTGTVVRTSAEAGPDATWLATAQGHLRVSGPQLAGVPEGARVEAVLSPGPAVHRVLSIRIDGQRVRTEAQRSAAAPRPVGHDVTVALVTPPGAGRDPMTLEALKKTVDGPVAAYWREQSEGTVRLHVGAALDWYATPYSCGDTWKLWDDVGRQAGYRPGPNRHLLVYITSDGALPDCYSGLATVGAQRSSGGAIYVRVGLASLLAHEFGHNLGLRHSQSLQCGGASDGRYGPAGWSPDCKQVPYGDWYDVMGMSWQHLGTLSAAQALRLGVLGKGRAQTITRTAVTVLGPLAAHRGLSALLVEAPGGARYMLEYRPATGRDDWLVRRPHGLGAGLLVRRDQPDPEHVGETLLLDASASPAAAGDRDSAAERGRPVLLDDGRVAVTVLSQGDGHAKVRVEIATGGDRTRNWPGSRLRDSTRQAVPGRSPGP